MKPLKLPVWLAMLFSQFLVAQIPTKPLGTSNMLLGNIGSCYPTNFSSLNNPALLGLNQNLQLAITHETPYMQQQLAISAASVQTEIKKTPIGLSLMQSGNEYFKQQLVSLGMGKKLGKNLRIGLALNYLFSNQFQHKNLHNLYGSVGFIIQINKQLFIATHLVNPTASAYKLERRQPLGQFYQVGLSYQFSENILLLTEYLVHAKLNGQLKFGLLYQIRPQLDFRMGFSRDLENISGGICLKKGPIKWVIGAQMHRILGISPSTELYYSMP